MINLSKETKIIRHSPAVAAGAATITPSAGVDTHGFESCLFIVAFGTIVSGAATSIKVQQSSDDGSSDGYSDLLGTSVTISDTSDDKLAYIEIVRPEKRYLKLIVSRATQNSTVDGIVAILSGAKYAPTTHDTTVITTSETHYWPIEGTA